LLLSAILLLGLDLVGMAGKCLASTLEETTEPSADGAPSYLTPAELQLSVDGLRIFVVCEDDDSLLTLNAQTGRVVGRTRVGHKPKGIALSPDGKTLYVSNEWSDTVSEIDTGSLYTRRTFKTGWGPIGLTTDKAGRFLYVADSIGDDVSVLDLSRGVEIKRLAASRSPHWVTLSRDGRRVYVSNLLPRLAPTDQQPVSELTVIDAQRQIVAERILIPGAIQLQQVAEAPRESGGYLVVPLTRPKNLNPLVQVAQGWILTHGLAVIRPKSENPPKAAVHVDQVLLDDIDQYYAGATSAGFTLDGRHLLVVSSEANVISIIDTNKLNILLGLGVPEDFSNRLDAAQKFVVRRLATGANPVGLAIAPNGRTAYTANRLDDSLTTVDLRELVASSKVSLDRLGGLSPVRRGERLFHDASFSFQGQFACASCHPDNHIDGLAWNLETPELGHDRVLNRTLRGIADTAPYKWNGHNPDLEIQCGLRAARFVFHSEGFDRDQLQDLVAFLKSIPLPPNRHLAPGEKLNPTQERGKRAYFARQCDTCHVPQTHYQNGMSADVGTAARNDTAGTFDVPQLDRVYERGPYLHNGKALSLEEIWTKFNVQGKHGATSDMTKGELNDLVEFLKTL
jgi:YVTN family beta-propeller protein